MLQPLMNSIDQLTDVHEELFALSLRKRDALIKSDAEQLTSIHQEEVSLLKRVEQKEKERMELVTALLQAHGQNPDEATLAQLIELSTEEQDKEKLKEKALRLQQVLIELQELNQFNTRLITDSLQFIQYSLDLFTDQSSDQVNYQPPVGQQGKSSATERRSFFDTKA